MIRIYYNEQGDITWTVSTHAAPAVADVYIDHEDDNIKINCWRVDIATKQLIAVEPATPFSRFSK